MNRNDLIKKLADRKMATADANRTICVNAPAAGKCPILCICRVRVEPTARTK